MGAMIADERRADAGGGQPQPDREAPAEQVAAALPADDGAV